MKSNDLDALRRRRSEAASERQRLELRTAHGERLVNALQMVGEGVKLEDFSAEKGLVPFAITWSERLEDAGGLVAAYVSRDRAFSIAKCLASKVHTKSGLIGIYGNAYLGYCSVEKVSIEGMLVASEKIDDAVVFYPDPGDGAVVFDCYSSNPGKAYSVLVQGAGLIESLRNCFQS